ncbi:Structure-specific endonuclease subunit slx4 [Lachnellula suecica]|uniref:Structure-specific endonuclease subunit SLX4 n=1 Tax=Lachnellula suecica TaxID=602035 RepID=A0A8T9CKX8_9HELO|nr:Structure-specific endonuclease subunit slx4 [Lachnellula suecica]
MVSAEVFTLSSTPPRQLVTYHMSSSPGLPSPSEIFEKKPQTLRTGSRATPIPEYAAASFTSAATLFNTASENLKGLDAIRSFQSASADDLAASTTEPAKAAKPKPRAKKVATKKDDWDKVAKPVRKPAAKKEEGGIEGEGVKKPRKSRAKKSEEFGEDGKVKEVPKRSRAKKVDAEQTGDGSVKEKAARKSRAKKTDGDSQPKLTKGRVTKGSKLEGASNAKTVEITDPFADPLDYGLVEAVRRRRAWTPPPATTQTSITPARIDVSGEEISLLESGEKNHGFKDLFGSFGFTTGEANPIERASSGEAGTRKRKLDMVKTNVSEAAAIPKPKAVKKKAKTITEQATSAYMDEEEELPVQPAPLLQYFSYKNTDNNGFKVPPRPRSKSPVKGGLKPKKGSAQAPILLSPESALKQVGNQDFVFGTSSQLAREESPTFLRDLHEALQASNQIEDDPFADILDEPSLPAPCSSRGRTLATTKRTLWSAGARDSNDELLDVKMLDLVDSPAVARMLASSAVLDKAPSLAYDDEWLDLDAVGVSPIVSSVQQDLPKKVGPVEAAIREELLSSPPRCLTQRPESPKTLEVLKVPDAHQPKNASIAPARSQVPEIPDYNSYTTIQLAKELASYRFKPVKNRDQMITLLENCWEGRNRAALGILGTNMPLKSPRKASAKDPPSSSQPISPKKPRGRPRKDSNASPSPSKLKAKAKVGCPKKTDTVEGLELDSDTPLSQIRTPKKSPKKFKKPIEEISDSDTPMTPSPPRRRGSQLKSPPLPLRVSSSVDEEDRDIGPEALQASLFSHITRAVTSAPPSKNALEPNWQEKILLYDPIVLEDLTLWLNIGALEKVGWDGEVMPKEVKKWCESYEKHDHLSQSAVVCLGYEFSLDLAIERDDRSQIPVTLDTAPECKFDTFRQVLPIKTTTR